MPVLTFCNGMGRRHQCSCASRPWLAAPGRATYPASGGFAVKFYTKEGNFDLIGNNIPVMVS